MYIPLILENILFLVVFDMKINARLKTIKIELLIIKLGIVKKLKSPSIRPIRNRYKENKETEDTSDVVYVNWHFILNKMNISGISIIVSKSNNNQSI